MRKQVGWYDPKSGGICMMHGDAPRPAREKYSMPVFACGEDDRLMDEIRVQTLENQVAMLLMMLQSRGEVIVEIETRRNLVSMRKSSVELLERLKKNEN